MYPASSPAGFTVVLNAMLPALVTQSMSASWLARVAAVSTHSTTAVLAVALASLMAQVYGPLPAQPLKGRLKDSMRGAAASCPGGPCTVPWFSQPDPVQRYTS